MATPLAELRPPELPLKPQVQLQALWHRYGSGGWTLQDIDLELREGELVGLLGPSGCGKTTLLRLIAGFEKPERGRVCINGREVAGPQRWLVPERRGVGMVFQDYALFPHLNAWANACFGLRRGGDTSRAAWLLELLGLQGLEQRYPHELSGGQRQRLALARALAPGPAVVLLDEPFSNLDVEVRLRLRSELPGVLSQCGACGLIVTHDPEEALAICDRVAVLEQGILHQIASPRELVEQPASAFVGRFVLQANLLPLQRTPDGTLSSVIGPWRLADDAAVPAPGADLQLLVSPEDLELVPDASGDGWVLGREFLGREWLYQVQLGEQRLRLRLPLDHDWSRSQRCQVRQRQGARGLLYPDRLAVRAL
jgi:iron(III) transport system ATP-binding protein